MKYVQVNCNENAIFTVLNLDLAVVYSTFFGKYFKTTEFKIIIGTLPP